MEMALMRLKAFSTCMAWAEILSSTDLMPALASPISRLMWLSAVVCAAISLRMAESWAGMIDATPDAVPVISPVDSLPGLHIATGFSGHGFGIGPGAGRLAADLVSGAPPVVDPYPFRYSRMIDGTKLVPDAGL